MERVAHPSWKPILVFLASIITVPVVMLLKLPFGFIGVVTSFVLIQLFLHEVYLKAAERFAGAVVASVLGVLILEWLYPYPFLGLALSALLVFIFMYYFVERLHDYGMLFAVLTLALMVNFGFFDSQKMAFVFATYWSTGIAIGCMVVVMLALGVSIKSRFCFQQAESHMVQDAKGFHLESGLIALRVVGALVSIIALQHVLKQFDTTIQAVIAAVVVTVQRQVHLAYHRLFFRVLGVLVGTGIAVVCGYLLEQFHIPYLSVFFIVLFLTLFSWLSQKCPAYLEYFFLQTGVMLPLILMTDTGEIYNHTIGMARALGSIEGGVVGLLWVYALYLPIHWCRKQEIMRGGHV